MVKWPQRRFISLLLILSAGSLAGALGGGKAGGLADLASLAGGFSQLKLDPGMIGKFVPVILNFVQSKGGAGAQQLLAKALQK